MPELAEFSVSPIEYTDDKGNRLDVSRYQYKPYPKMLYRADGAQKVMGSAEEHKKAGAEWGETPTKRPIWDTRKVEAGFSISEFHLGFLQAHGFEMSTMEEAKAWFQGLNDEAQEAFLTDAAKWEPPVEEKRKPGRPKNPVDVA
jgi:hypothetical protein